MYLRINVRKRGCEHRVTVLLIHMLTGKDNQLNMYLTMETESTCINIHVHNYVNSTSRNVYAYLIITLCKPCNIYVPEPMHIHISTLIHTWPCHLMHFLELCLFSLWSEHSCLFLCIFCHLPVLLRPKLKKKTWLIK